MSNKQLMPNQCNILHPIYGSSDCCLCNARAELESLKMGIRSLIRTYEMFEQPYSKTINLSVFRTFKREEQRKFRLIQSIYTNIISRLNSLLK